MIHCWQMNLTFSLILNGYFQVANPFFQVVSVRGEVGLSQKSFLLCRHPCILPYLLLHSLQFLPGIVEVVPDRGIVGNRVEIVYLLLLSDKIPVEFALFLTAPRQRLDTDAVEQPGDGEKCENAAVDSQVERK